MPKLINFPSDHVTRIDVGDIVDADQLLDEVGQDEKASEGQGRLQRKWIKFLQRLGYEYRFLKGGDGSYVAILNGEFFSVYEIAKQVLERRRSRTLKVLSKD